MATTYSKQRIYASLLVLGAGLLLFRTLKMVGDGALDVLEAWVSALLFFEMVLDAACMAAGIRWWIGNDRRFESLPLRLGAAAAILHAARVLVFVMGRVGPWIDFDVQPAQRADHAERWSWGWLYFAAIMSVLGLVGVGLIWWYRRRSRLQGN